MEVLFVYTSYPLSQKDWRGRFIYDMAHALATRPGLRLRLWGPPGPIPRLARPVASPQDIRFLRALLQRGGIAHLLKHPSYVTARASLTLLKRLRYAYKHNHDADVIHVNWLQNALPLWGTRIPALVTVLGTDVRVLGLPGLRTLLRSVFRQRPCIIAPNADWMVPILEDHFQDVAEIRPIPFGVDPRWFVVDRDAPPNGPRKWLAVLRVTRDKIGPLFAWARETFTHQDELHLFGPNQENLEIPAWVHYHGAADPTALRDQWFPTATALVSLSRHDEGRPQVILEAMASQLPVIASPLPAHRNIVQRGVTGILVDNKQEFASALAQLSDPRVNRAMGSAARKWIRDTLGTWDDCAARYEQAYHQLLTRRQ